MNKRILIFASGNLYKIGGVQRSYQLLTQYLVDKNYDITLIGWEDNNSSENDKLAYSLPDKVKVKLIPKQINFSGFSQIVRIVNEIDPAVTIIVNSSEIALFILAAVKTCKSKVILSIRGSYHYCLKHLWPCKRTLELAFLCSNSAHVLMKSYADCFSNQLKEKIQFIPSQIEPSKENAMPDKPINNKRFVILYSGRFSFEKRVHLLIDAFCRLKDYFPNWDLWLYGHGPLYEEYNKQIEKLDLNDRVIFGNAKNTSEMYNIYPKAHINVLPSEQEGCPMGLREAMAHAVPVIGYYECSGTNEIIEHKVNGLLVDNDDYVSRLEEAIRYLIERPSMRKNMGLKGKETVKQYDPYAINAEWEQLIRDTINEKNKASPQIRDKYINEHVNAENILADLIQKKRYRSVYIFERNSELYEKHKKEYLTIYNNKLFNRKFYLNYYFNVKKMGIDPLLHYVSDGWKLGYHPSPEFDNQLYQKMFMENEEKFCPLYHFYIKGRFEGAFPIATEIDYYDKKPQRKPKYPYSITDEAEIELNLINKCST